MNPKSQTNIKRCEDFISYFSSIIGNLKPNFFNNLQISYGTKKNNMIYITSSSDLDITIIQYFITPYVTGITRKLPLFGLVECLEFIFNEFNLGSINNLYKHADNVMNSVFGYFLVSNNLKCKIYEKEYEYFDTICEKINIPEELQSLILDFSGVPNFYEYKIFYDINEKCKNAISNKISFAEKVKLKDKIIKFHNEIIH